MSLHDEIRIIREFEHAPARVFNAYTSREVLPEWLSPSADVKLRVDEFQCSPEGRYRYEYSFPDGSLRLLTGIFLVVEPAKRLSFSWEWLPPDPHAGVNSHVEITFEEWGNGTRLTIIHSKLQANGMAERHADGWRKTLARLEKCLQLPDGVKI